MDIRARHLVSTIKTCLSKQYVAVWEPTRGGRGLAKFRANDGNIHPPLMKHWNGSLCYYHGTHWLYPHATEKFGWPETD